LFANIYQKAYQDALSNDKNLIIVGGTSFYLKALIDGLSKEIAIEPSTTQKVDNILLDIPKAYQKLQQIDKVYADKITHNDKFRIHKALSHYYQTGESLSSFFEKNSKIPFIKGKIDIYEIEIDKKVLQSRIYQRTQNMLKSGLIEEIEYLQKRYTREPKCFKSIGIKESFDYLDGLINKDELIAQISSNTVKLAKRQRTFNKTQFNSRVCLSAQDIEKVANK
jgi:tRNA dimethylallyltransferase